MSNGRSASRLRGDLCSSRHLFDLNDDRAASLGKLRSVPPLHTNSWIMRSVSSFVVSVVITLAPTAALQAQAGRPATPDAPTIEQVEIVADAQPGDPGIVWADDFESSAQLRPRYQDVGSNGGRY